MPGSTGNPELEEGFEIQAQPCDCMVGVTAIQEWRDVAKVIEGVAEPCQSEVFFVLCEVASLWTLEEPPGPPLVPGTYQVPAWSFPCSGQGQRFTLPESLFPHLLIGNSSR